MLSKKQKVGKRIWELFALGWSYNKIANNLKISKSVVSNVLNYSLPADMWYQEDIKKRFEKRIKEIEEDCNNKISAKNLHIKKLRKELQELEEEISIVINITIIITTITGILGNFLYFALIKKYGISNFFIFLLGMVITGLIVYFTSKFVTKRFINV
jgi:predicted transcriptional regulator